MLDYIVIGLVIFIQLLLYNFWLRHQLHKELVITETYLNKKTQLYYEALDIEIIHLKSRIKELEKKWKKYELTNETINLTGFKYNITITDNHIKIGCKQFTLDKALKLNKRWSNTKEKYEEAQHLESMRKVIVELIKNRIGECNE